MLFFRPRGLSLRSQNTMHVCASCLAKRASFASAPPRQPQPKKTTKSSGLTPPPQNSTAESGPSYPPPNRRRRRERPPQPGPPNPPWPAPQNSQATGRRQFMPAKALAESVVMINRMRGPNSPASGLSLAVPRMPDPDTDFTNMGPGVYPPWRLGGVHFRAVTDKNLVNSMGGPKRLGLKLRFCNDHIMHPHSIKFLGADSPDTSNNNNSNSNSGGGGHANQQPIMAVYGPSGFPHCFSEVVRRWYANKNRTDPLWWYVSLVSADNAGGMAAVSAGKTVVRSKTHAKVQHALKTALAQRGYSPSGVRLSPEDSSLSPPTSSPKKAVGKYPHLYGTVRVDAVLQRVVDVEYGDLVKYLTLLLTGVEDKLGTNGGRSSGSLVTFYKMDAPKQA